MTPESLFSLHGKVALVTGGATGIGRMAVEGLAAAGARVLTCSRKGDACEAVAKEINAMGYSGSVEGFAGDVSSEEGIEEIVAEVNGRTGELHILMNNAGVTWGTPLGQFPYAAWQKVMNINVAGMFHLTQGLLGPLAAAGEMGDPARVVNVGSVMGEVPQGDGAYSYAVSKGAVHHMTKILAKELADRQITVNALAPGPFVSKMTAFVTAAEKTRDIVAAGVPLKRVGGQEDIAGCMQFLCGQGGAYISGAIIPVSGGINVMSGPPLFEEAMQ